jgi:hypothetical protein
MRAVDSKLIYLSLHFHSCCIYLVTDLWESHTIQYKFPCMYFYSDTFCASSSLYSRLYNTNVTTVSISCRSHGSSSGTGGLWVRIWGLSTYSERVTTAWRHTITTGNIAACPKHTRSKTLEISLMQKYENMKVQSSHVQNAKLQKLASLLPPYISIINGRVERRRKQCRDFYDLTHSIFG